MSIGGRTFQMGLPTRTTSRVSVLFADVACHRGVVVGRVGVGRLQAVYVVGDAKVAQPCTEGAREDLGVPDLEVHPAAVAVVLPGT
jgi:hypothetical protein